MIDAEDEFYEGYRDGRDRDCPEPSENRSYAYRHSFAVGRAELEGTPIPAQASREAARLAEQKDLQR